MKKKKPILSTKLTMKFANSGKLDQLHRFINEYKLATQKFVDIMWEIPKISSMAPKSITDQVDSWISARALQASAKQASGIVRGTRKSAKILGVDPTKPELESLECQLDSRFCKIELGKPNSFDCWITIRSLGDKIKVEIPTRLTRHFNKLAKTGKLIGCIRLSKSMVSLCFEQDLPKIRKEGKLLGLDVGIVALATTSDGAEAPVEPHQWDLKQIVARLSRRTKGSKGFERAQNHRSNFIGWSINRLNLDGIRRLNIEEIKDLRKGKKCSRKLSHWTYTQISKKIKSKCAELGVQVSCLDPAYTSQRCSSCGWVQKSNRSGVVFICKACGLSVNADWNASINLSLDLPDLGREIRFSGANRAGFYWAGKFQELIVPDGPKPIGVV